MENAAAETSTHLQLAVATCLPAPRGNHARIFTCYMLRILDRISSITGSIL